MNHEDQSQDFRVIPCDDFSLNVFLDNIANEITDEEVERLKFFCSGRGGLGKATREKINNCLQLFQTLKELRLLSKENLASLQGMLWHLGRKDLCEKFITYCRNSDNKIHFVPASDQPTNGYRFVNFHIRGTQRLSQDSLRRLRQELSDLLCCPPEHIIIDGIQPANSIHIIFMIPEDRLQFLINIGDREKEQLCFHGVDCFEIGDDFVYCTEFTTGEDVPNLDKDGEVRRILRKNKELGRDLEYYQNKCRETQESCTTAITDYEREMKYSHDNFSEQITRLNIEVNELKKQVQEYQLNCLQLTNELENIRGNNVDGIENTLCVTHESKILGKITKLRRTLSQADLEELLEISSNFQSQIIDLLQSSNASKTTSKIVKLLTTYKNDVDNLKAQIQTLVTTELFEDVYPVVLNLKSIEDAIVERKSANPEVYCAISDSDDDYDSD